jgi:hypothetical protein
VKDDQELAERERVLQLAERRLENELAEQRARASPVGEVAGWVHVGAGRYKVLDPGAFPPTILSLSINLFLQIIYRLSSRRSAV